MTDSGERISAASVAAFIETLPNGRVTGWRAGIELPPAHPRCDCRCCEVHRSTDDGPIEAVELPDPENVPVRISFIVHVQAIRDGKVF